MDNNREDQEFLASRLAEEETTATGQRSELALMTEFVLNNDFERISFMRPLKFFFSRQRTKRKSSNMRVKWDRYAK
jgi:asparaginyl-tRNA synthetase